MAKRLLPYRGLGSGIRRALEDWPDIEFVDDREGCLFIAIIHRAKVHGKTKKAPVKANKEANKALKVQSAEVNASLNDLQTQIIGLIRLTSNISYNELSAATGKDRSTIMRNISKLKKAGLLRRVGSKKTGYWEVL